jgi:hypothetical protein
MPLTVCRCCGGKVAAEQLRRDSNPNICPNCERLLEDESPSLMANVGSLDFKTSDGKELFDQWATPPIPQSPSSGQITLPLPSR